MNLKITIRKMAILCLAAMIAISMTSCSKEYLGETTETESSAENDISNKKLKVTLCVSSINDSSHQQSAYEGLLQVGEELGEEYEVNVLEMGEDTTKWRSYLYEAADAGADIIIGVGSENKEYYEEIPTEYPDIKFILIGQKIDYSGADLSNVLTVIFDTSQAGYLAGAAAAYYTISDQWANPNKLVGFIGGVDEIETNDYLVGFAEGVEYVDSEIRILTSYVGDTTSSSKAGILAKIQMINGVDVIFHVAGEAGNGVIEACSEKEGIVSIGIIEDSFLNLENESLQAAVLTSILRKPDNVVIKILKDFAEDKDSVPFGKKVNYGLDYDAVGILFNDNLTTGIGDANVKAVKSILEKIKKGEIRVHKINELTPDEFKALITK